MKRHIRLLEIFGMALALGAWVVDWWYVQDMRQAESKLNAALVSVQDAYATANVSDVIQLEAAVTRAHVHGDNLPSGPLGNYAAAWRSPEVRGKWLVRTKDTVGFIANLVFVIESAEEHYGLPHESREVRAEAISLMAELEDVESTLREEASWTTQLTFTSAQAGDWDNHIRPAFGQAIQLINSTMQGLTQKASQRSLLHRIVFGAGAVLLILARLLEWRLEGSRST